MCAYKKDILSQIPESCEDEADRYEVELKRKIAALEKECAKEKLKRSSFDELYWRLQNNNSNLKMENQIEQTRKSAQDEFRRVLDENIKLQTNLVKKIRSLELGDIIRDYQFRFELVLQQDSENLRDIKISCETLREKFDSLPMVNRLKEKRKLALMARNRFHSTQAKYEAEILDLDKKLVDSESSKNSSLVQLVIGAEKAKQVDLQLQDLRKVLLRQDNEKKEKREFIKDIKEEIINLEKMEREQIRKRELETYLNRRAVGQTAIFKKPRAAPIKKRKPPSIQEGSRTFLKDMKTSMTNKNSAGIEGHNNDFAGLKKLQFTNTSKMNTIPSTVRTGNVKKINIIENVLIQSVDVMNVAKSSNIAEPLKTSYQKIIREPVSIDHNVYEREGNLIGTKTERVNHQENKHTLVSINPIHRPRAFEIEQKVRPSNNVNASKVDDFDTLEVPLRQKVVRPTQDFESKQIIDEGDNAGVSKTNPHSFDTSKTHLPQNTEKKMCFANDLHLSQDYEIEEVGIVDNAWGAPKRYPYSFDKSKVTVDHNATPSLLLSDDLDKLLKAKQMRESTQLSGEIKRKGKVFTAQHSNSPMTSATTNLGLGKPSLIKEDNLEGKSLSKEFSINEGKPKSKQIKISPIVHFEDFFGTHTNVNTSGHYFSEMTVEEGRSEEASSFSFNMDVNTFPSKSFGGTFSGGKDASMDMENLDSGSLGQAFSDGKDDSNEFL